MASSPRELLSPVPGQLTPRRTFLSHPPALWSSYKSKGQRKYHFFKKYFILLPTTADFCKRDNSKQICKGNLLFTEETSRGLGWGFRVNFQATKYILFDNEWSLIHIASLFLCLKQNGRSHSSSLYKKDSSHSTIHSRPLIQNLWFFMLIRTIYLRLRLRRSYLNESLESGPGRHWALPMASIYTGGTREESCATVGKDALSDGQGHA